MLFLVIFFQLLPRSKDSLNEVYFLKSTSKQKKMYSRSYHEKVTKSNDIFLRRWNKNLAHEVNKFFSQP